MIEKKEYSGFIELFFEKKIEYHKGAIKLNCARQGINYIIKAKNYKKVFLPFYICKTVYDALEVEYEFYYLNEDFSPKIAPKKITESCAIIYPNYFGSNNDKVLAVLKKYPNVIVDNTQAFFQKIKNCDVVYSPRKFFWVSDGAYVFCDKKLELEIPQDFSYQRMLPLLKRIELGSNATYVDSLQNEDDITQSKMRKMSALTNQILYSIDYEKMAKIRKENFAYLHKKLGKVNELEITISQDEVPMTYPFLIDSRYLRDKLIENKIYIPQWWKDAILYAREDSFENYLSNNLIPLPIDHRYNKADLDFIASQVLKGI